MSSLSTCNHETHLVHEHGLVIDHCGICGEAVWTRPARDPIDWRFTCLVVVLLLAVIGLLSWPICIWLRAA